MVKYVALFIFFVAVTTASPIAKSKPSYYENPGYNTYSQYSQPIGHGLIGTQYPSAPISQPLTYSGISAPISQPLTYSGISAPISHVPYVSPQISSYTPSSYTGGSSYFQSNTIPYTGDVGAHYLPTQSFGGYNHAGYNPIQTIGHV